MTMKALCWQSLTFISLSFFFHFTMCIHTTENVQDYQGCFWHCIRHDKWCLLWQAFNIYQGYTFESIKAVSDTVFTMSNTVPITTFYLFTYDSRLFVYVTICVLLLQELYEWQSPYWCLPEIRPREDWLRVCASGCQDAKGRASQSDWKLFQS